jgi:hypothetical protein
MTQLLLVNLFEIEDRAGSWHECSITEP